MKKENYAIAILSMVILGMSYVILTNNLMTSTNTAEHVGYTGLVCPTVTRVDGTVEDLGCYKNYLTYNGTNHTTAQLFEWPYGASATNVVDTMTLGNTTGNFEQSAHPGNITDCGLTQVKGLIWNASTAGQSGNVTNSTTWTSTCDNHVVNTTGLATVDEMYFAGNNFSTSVTLQSNDQLTVTWYVWITGS